MVRRGPTTTADLADDLGLTPAAVRKNLDTLLAAGLVEGSDRAPYGPAALETPRGRGRPAKVFTLTTRGKEFVGSHHDTLAVAALRHMSRVPGAVASFAQELAAAFENRNPQVALKPTVAARTKALVTALNDDGYVAVTTAGPAGSIQVCQHTCPIGQAAVEFPEMCEAETETFSRMTGVHVTRLATIAGGAQVCTTLVPTAGKG